MKRISPFLILIILTSLIILGCEVPFFYKQVTPVEKGQAVIPEEVLGLLQDAYEFQDVALFQSLIYDPLEFNSYTEAGGALSASYTSVKVDSSIIPYHLIGSLTDRFVVLSYSQELQVHQNLFTKAEEIAFVNPLTVAELSYESEYSVDSTGAAVIDTILAVVKTDNNEIVVTAPEIELAFGSPSWKFPVSGQYFIMKKNLSGHWKIWKWIETGE